MGHGGTPVFPIPVPDEHGNRRAQRLTQPDAAQKLYPIPLDLHATTATVTLLSANEFWIHVSLRLEIQARWDPLEQSGQCLAV